MCWEIKIIKYAEERSIYFASNYYGVSRPTIRYKNKEKEELCRLKKISTVILHKGKLTKRVPHKEEIFDFILYNRALENTVASNEIIHNIWSFDENISWKIIEYTSKVVISYYVSAFSYI